MATTSSSMLFPAAAKSNSGVRSNRRRRVSPQAGKALVVLGHAIEYLTDEFVHEGMCFSTHNEQLEAIQILMALNRQVYFECPQVPSLGERFLSLLGVHEV